MKIILTGSTGMVGEGVLIECIENPNITKIFSISRKSCGIKNEKLEEFILSDFFHLEEHTKKIKGYDACFYCAGISSVGMNEEKYTIITYDTTIIFAKSVLQMNPDITFCYVSGKGTDSTESGKTMWARVKGKTENALLKLGFKHIYNFRPGAMEPFAQQKNVKNWLVWIVRFIKLFVPKSILQLKQVGLAMVNVVQYGYANSTLEIDDIKKLAGK